MGFRDLDLKIRYRSNEDEHHIASDFFDSGIERGKNI